MSKWTNKFCIGDSVFIRYEDEQVLATTIKAMIGVPGKSTRYLVHGEERFVEEKYNW